ncbi:MAG TPA: ABATE domain-containing protein [Thermomicrobiales bacterium]|nr:ABATE domain-containing protein [Thermomicrobiales bacterium]
MATEPTLEPIRTSEPFEFVGGALCLDFVNTGSDWRAASRSRLPTAGTERLAEYGDFVDWARQGGVLSDEAAAALTDAAAAAPDEAAKTLRRTRRFRAALHAAVTAAMAGEDASPAALNEMNHEIGALLAASRLAPADGGYRLTRPADEDAAHPALDAPLAAVTRSALDLLTTPDLANVHACASESCGWLFLDRSGRRRWCSMASCGTTAKVRRFRSRHHTHEEAAG